MDVKTAFLEGNPIKDVCRTQLEVFSCKLQRSIYGLKQASWSWNIQSDETIKKFGFLQNLMSLVSTRRLVGVKSCSLYYVWMTY